MSQPSQIPQAQPSMAMQPAQPSMAMPMGFDPRQRRAAVSRPVRKPKSLSKVLKIVLGIVVVALIGYLIYTFVLSGHSLEGSWANEKDPGKVVLKIKQISDAEVELTFTQDDGSETTSTAQVISNDEILHEFKVLFMTFSVRYVKTNTGIQSYVNDKPANVYIRA